jgi:hypothetical protein
MEILIIKNKSNRILLRDYIIIIIKKTDNYIDKARPGLPPVL